MESETGFPPLLCVTNGRCGFKKYAAVLLLKPTKSVINGGY
jgi:hypothetical protein